MWITLFCPKFTAGRCPKFFAGFCPKFFDGKCPKRKIYGGKCRKFAGFCPTFLIAVENVRKLLDFVRNDFIYLVRLLRSNYSFISGPTGQDARGGDPNAISLHKFRPWKAA